MQIMNKQFNTEFRKKKARFSRLVQFNTEFRKKQDPPKIVHSCKVANYKDIQRIFFKISRNMIESCKKKKKIKNKKYRYLKIFSSKPAIKKILENTARV